MKKFVDAPESKSVPIQLNVLNKTETLSMNPTNIKTNEEEDQGKEYIFNEFTAAAYDEYEVVKINKYNAKQERILGIDMYHIYNDLPKNKDKKSKLLI